jgi:hypothetical protein
MILTAITGRPKSSSRLAILKRMTKELNALKIQKTLKMKFSAFKIFFFFLNVKMYDCVGVASFFVSSSHYQVCLFLNLL